MFNCWLIKLTVTSTDKMFLSSPLTAYSKPAQSNDIFQILESDWMGASQFYVLTLSTLLQLPSYTFYGLIAVIKHSSKLLRHVRFQEINYGVIVFKHFTSCFLLPTIHISMLLNATAPTSLITSVTNSLIYGNIMEQFQLLRLLPPTIVCSLS